MNWLIQPFDQLRAAGLARTLLGDWPYPERYREEAPPAVVIHRGGGVREAGTAESIVEKLMPAWIHHGLVGLPYHWIIQRDGKAVQCLGPHVVSHHAFGHNSRSQGIMLAGDFRHHAPEPAQLYTLLEILRATVRAQGPVDVLTHDEVNARVGRPTKRCPGFSLDCLEVPLHPFRDT